MASLLFLLLGLLVAHGATRANVRRQQRGWKPAELWTEEDVQAWTALIEPIELPEKEEPAWPQA